MIARNSCTIKVTASHTARRGHASTEAALRYQHATREREVVIAETLDAMVLGNREAGWRRHDHEPASQPASVTPAGPPNVTSIESARAARHQRERERERDEMRHECAMVEATSTWPDDGDALDQDVDESGRRESNPRSQLGKLMFCR